MRAAAQAGRRRPSGFTLIELVVYIVVCSMAMTGVLALFQAASAKSADAIAAERSIEAARSLLEEIEALPLTECERAGAPEGCSAPPPWSPAPGRERGSKTAPFATVADYSGYAASAPSALGGEPYPGLDGRGVRVRVTPTAAGLAPASDAAKIEVIISGPAGSYTLTGYRLRRSLSPLRELGAP